MGVICRGDLTVKGGFLEEVTFELTPEPGAGASQVALCGRTVPRRGNMYKSAARC